MKDSFEEKTEISDRGKSKQTIVLFAVCWLLVFFWRLFLLGRYAWHYLDDDQAILWYGTVHFAHGCFPEPCFFGQDYNCMLESLLAVPLYMAGWPLNYALPTVSTLLCILPFLYCSILLWKREKKTGAFLCVLLLAMTGWHWDVLASVPRAFIPGFPWAVMGTVMMNDPIAKRKKIFAGATLATIGVCMTASAAAILGIGMLAILLGGKKNFWRLKWAITGMLPGGVLWGGEKYYYTIHAADIVTKHSFRWLDGEAFTDCIAHLPELLSGAVLGGRILLPLIVAVAFVFLAYKKQYRTGILLLASCIGIFLVFSLGWMVVCGEGSILFGRLRMNLFWIPLFLCIISLNALDNEKDQNRFIPAIIMVVVLLCVAGKTMIFNKELSDPDSPLFQDDRVTVMSVDGLRTQAGEVLELAKTTGSDVAVCLNYASVFAYGASALYYEEPVDFYVPDRERRVWLYHKLCETKGQRLLLFSLPVSENMQLAVEDMGDNTVPGYFEQLYGLKRGGDLEWGMRGNVE